MLRDGLSVSPQGWLAAFVATIAADLVGTVSVTLVVLYGQSRILYTMGRDGMLPGAFRRVSPRTGTPVFTTLLTGT